MIRILKGFGLALSVTLVIGTGVAVAAFVMPNEFQPTTPISSSAVNKNFQAISDELEALREEIDVARTDAGAPPGSIVAFAGHTAPNGWLPCDGRALSREEFAALFAAIGTSYGAQGGPLTFNIPDLRGRVVAGEDDMGGVPAERLTQSGSGFDASVLGRAGGDERMMAHTHGAGSLTADLAGAHSHSVDNTSYEHPQGGRQFVWTSGTRHTTSHTTGTAGDHTHSISGSTAMAGSGNGQGNVQPTIILQYLIRAF